MMLQTKHFGEIEVDDQAVISFPYGLPGFNETRAFTILEPGSPETDFKWLQCVDKPDLAFVIIDPFLVRNNYDIELDDKLISEIEIEKPEDVAIFSLVVIPEDLTKMSVNLKAPLVINIPKRKGRQVLLDTDKYSVRHYILEEVKSRQENLQEVEGNANIIEEKGAVHHHK